MNDLSSPKNPLVMIALLIGFMIAGVQLGRHKDHFIQEQPGLEELEDRQRQKGNLRRNYWGTNGR